MKIKIVYFIYLLPGRWIDIFTEQMNALKALELYEEADEIFVSVISPDESQLVMLNELITTQYNKLQIKNIYKDNVYEYAGFEALYDIAEDDNDTVLLYFHSKGMTSDTAETRRRLFKYTIQNYKAYLDEFENNPLLDTAGAIPNPDGFIYYNFFWTRSSYFKNYVKKPEIVSNRYDWEVWIGCGISMKKNNVTFSPLIQYNGVTTHQEVGYVHDNLMI